MGSKWLYEVIAKLTSEDKHQYEQEPCDQCVGFVVRPSCEYEQVAPGTNAEYQNRKQKIREPDCDNRVGLHGQDERKRLWDFTTGLPLLQVHS